MGSIGSNLQEVKRRIAAACATAGRDANIRTSSAAPGAPPGVLLLAVSKTFDEAAVREAHAAGQQAFGENYVQEALAKIAALADLRPAIEWHLIGPLQSNKTRAVSEAFDWVHSIDPVSYTHLGVDAEAPHALRADREIALLAALEIGRLLVVHHRTGQCQRVLAGQRLRADLGDLAVDLDGRWEVRSQKQVRAVAADHQPQQVVHKLGCLVAFHSVPSMLRGRVWTQLPTAEPALPGRWSVSYTHLDVYKRQGSGLR